MAVDSKDKRCFVISAIGEADSDIRKRADQLFHKVIEPVAEKLGYAAERADHIAAPGLITNQIIARLLKDDLVIADLTGLNANVFYELGVRHTAGLHAIHMIDNASTIPFDIKHFRTIVYDLTNPAGINDAKEQLEKQMSSLDSTPIDNPVTQISGKGAFLASGSKSESRPELALAFTGKERSNLEIILSDPQDYSEESAAEYLSSVRKRHPKMGESDILKSMAGINGVSGEQISEFNAELDRFYKRQEGYFIDKLNHGNKVARTIEVSLQLLNTGECPAQRSQLNLAFPAGLEFRKVEEPFPEEPSAPQRPRSRWDSFAASIPIDYRAFQPKIPKIDLESAFNKPNVTGPDFQDSTVRFEIQHIMHHVPIDLPQFFVTFPSYDEAQSFEIEYTLHVANLPKPVTGKLPVRILKRVPG